MAIFSTRTLAGTIAAAFALLAGAAQADGDGLCEGKTQAETNLDFYQATVKESTLHKEGGRIVYENIGVVRDNPVNLVVTVVEGTKYSTTKPQKNGKGGGGMFGNINLQTFKKPKDEDGLYDGTGNFQFCFHDKETDDLVEVDSFQWSVYDLDERHAAWNGIKEKLIIDATQASDYQLYPSIEESEVKLSCEDGTETLPCPPGVRTVFHSSTQGPGSDNPTDPNNMTELQLERSVIFRFDNTACWTFTYSHYCPPDEKDPAGPGCRWYGGGNFLYAGEAEQLIEEGECVTKSPTAAPSIAATPSPTSKPSVSPAPTFLLPDCYEGTKLIKEDSSDLEMCNYDESMVEIKDMNKDEVIIAINDVWSPDALPEQMRVFVHTDGVDALSRRGGGFQCLEEEGSEIDIKSTDEFAVQCHQAGPDEPFLAVIDVVITDDWICGTNQVHHPCDRYGDPILESCSWRIVIPCDDGDICTEPPTAGPTESPTVKKTDHPTGSPSESIEDVVTEPPIVVNGEDDDDDFIFVPDCPEDVKVVKQVGVTEFPDPTEAVKIVSQDLSTVTVKLNQAWISPGDEMIPIDHIYYSFMEDTFDERCYEENLVEDGTFYDEITIQCDVTKPFALLAICLADDIENELLVEEDNAVVPKCCHPSFPPNTPVVCYTVEINCVTECIEEEVKERRGLLRGSGEESS